MSSGSMVLSIDQGTTSSRVVVYDAEAAVVASAQREHQQFFPEPGWVEHDPVEIWNNVRELIALVVARAGLDSSDVASIGITNQRETTVVWDRETGQPVYGAIVWQDVRTDPVIQQLVEDGAGPLIQQKTGLTLSSYFSASKIAWILDHVEAASDLAWEGRLAVGTMDSWLLWNLTGGPGRGEHATDITNASRTLLMDLHTGQWDFSLGEYFNIAPDILQTMLPTIKPSSGYFGSVAERIPLSGVPITGILGDQQAAAFGQTVFEDSEVKNTYGTGCFLLYNTGDTPVLSQHGLLTTVAYQLDGQPPRYALEGSIAQAGSVVQWLRDNLKIIERSEDVEALSESVADNGGVYFVPAFSGLFAPRWRSDARGIMIGLTGYATAGHIARAALEATAYQTLDVLLAVAEDTGQMPSAIRVDGGMAVNDHLMNFQSDILEVVVHRAVVVETTALGAAFASGLASGMWDDLEQLRGLYREDRSWQPTMDTEHRRRLIKGWNQAVEHSLGWIHDEA